MPDKREGKWTVGVRSPGIAWSLLFLLLLSIFLSFLSFGPAPSLSSMPGVPYGGFWSGTLLFLFPLILGSAVSCPIATALGGKFTLKRAFSVALISTFPIGVILVGWRIYTFLVHPYPVEGALLAAFGVALWMDTIFVAGIAGPNVPRSIPPAMAEPAVGLVMVLLLVGATPTLVLVALLFLLIPVAAGSLLLYATDRPLKREFGRGSVSIVRPLFDHINDRDPEGSRTMEEFFESTSREGNLQASVLAFGKKGSIDVLWVVPSVHPGPFAEIGASDLPHKLATRLSSAARQVVVPHAPCTHEQNLPTTRDVETVAQELSAVAKALEWGPPGKSSPLVSPYPGSYVRAQVLGSTALLVVSRSPEPSDDLDYSVGEMLRDEARRSGFPTPIVIDAHNSFVEPDQSLGAIPFGSPASFKVRDDAKAALEAASKALVDGPVRVGFARRSGYTPQQDSLGSEGLAVTVVEAAGKRTAYALFDGNNLVQGARERLLEALKRHVDEGEVMTTDNHIVHEVDGGVNPIGRKRSPELLMQDLEETLSQAVQRLAPAEVASTGTMVRKVRVLGPGVTYRLMTALSDSFHIFWMLFPATFAITITAELLVLALAG